MRSLCFAVLGLSLLACEQKAPPPSTARPATTVAAVPAADPPQIAAGTQLKCPVSGEEFTVKDKTPTLVYKGKRYAFCCADCIPDFNKNPDKFASQ
jgi:YHS domain-containing protein